MPERIQERVEAAQVCVCVCVCVREREREREKKGIGMINPIIVLLTVWVY